MKKLLFVVLAALTIVSCQKKETETLPQFQDVSFKAIEVTPNNGLKADDWDTLCVDVVPNYAHVVIEGVAYDPELFLLDGVLYTQALKLPVIEGNYCVEQFFLYFDDDDSGDYTEGDVIVFATPETGSHFGAYVTQGIEYCFPVTAFTKAELDIEVLCFKPAVYDDFGFDWFAVTEIVVRQFCFFGDICITNETFGLYANSIYAQGGVDPDEEAVFRVVVKDNGVEVPYSPFSNETIYGSGEALCVDYPDNLTEVNNFTFELQVWVPSTVPGVFVWQTYATFTSVDAGPLYYGQVSLGDNTTVKSFAIGTCSPMSNPIFEWLDPISPPPPPPPVVTAGYVPGGTKKGNARWRNLRLNGNGWELAVGQSIPTTNWTSFDFSGTGANYYFSPATTPNLVTYTYDAVTGDQTIKAVVDGGTFTKTQNNGNLGTVNYMQWQVNGDPGKILEFNNVQLTVGGETYNLGSFQTEYGDWYINYDLTSGFSLTGEMVINGQATGDEGMKLEVSAKEF